jgi:O-methyltransferase/methyltransferase family protein
MVAQRWAFWPLLQVLHRARRMGLWAEIKPLLRDRLFPVRSAPTKEGNPSPPILFQMATGYWVSQAIYVAAKLGIADLLTDGPQSCVALAAATGADAASLFRLMRALANVGVFSHVRRDCFALSRLAESLQADTPGSLKAMVMTIGEIHYQAFGSLLHSVQTGSPAFNHVFGTGLFDYLQQNADAADTFNQGMTNLSSMLAYAVMMAYDFRGVSSIVDIGGGEGKLLRKILELNPGMRGAVFDTPATIETANRDLSDGTRGERCLYIAGDFFESVPQGADAYLLCGVVHDWNDDRVITILRNCRTAMTKTGRLLLVDMLVPHTDSKSFSKLLDLNMLVMTGGRERTQAEFCGLLDSSDYRLTRIVPTMAPQSVIEAVPK